MQYVSVFIDLYIIYHTQDENLKSHLYNIVVALYTCIGCICVAVDDIPYY